MLNFYFLYSAVGIVIFLVSALGWSEFAIKTSTETMIFMMFTIIVSLVLGILFRNKFKFERIEVEPPRNSRLTGIIILLCFIEYLVCGQIPLISIIMKTDAYKSYVGIRGFHPLLVTFAVFYIQYLFYLFICFPKRKKLLWEYAAIFFTVFFLHFNRGGMLINLAMSTLIYLASKGRAIIRKNNMKIIILSMAFLIVVMYIFGGLGNLRMGYGWNDSSYIEFIGRINDNYPNWLPKQFAWVYLYITTPLNNLSYNVAHNMANPTLIGYVASYFPDFISKRIFSDVIVDHVLIDLNFNATLGFGRAYMNGGAIGMYGMFFYLFLGLPLLIKYVRPKKQYKMVYIAIMASIVLLLFFTHTISYSAISFPLIYPILSRLNYPKYTLIARKIRFHT